jgi:hypothetical protein
MKLRSIRRSAQAASIGVWYRAGPPFEAAPFFFDGVGRATGAVIFLFWCVFAAQTNDDWLHSDFGQPKSLRGL